MNIFLNVVLWKFQNVITLHNLGKKMLQRQYYSHFNMEKTDITDGILNTEKKNIEFFLNISIFWLPY